MEVVLQNEKRKVDSGEENNYKNLERSCQQELQGIVRSIASQAKAVISSFTPSPKNDILKWLQKVQ